ncbi:MAG: helix-turn-helix domain-containing protein [Agrobacterium cavarae]
MAEDKSFLKPIGNRLKTLRAELKFSNRDQFAEALGVPAKTLEKYEQGVSELPTKLLLHMRETFNVDLTWLITGAGLMLSTEAQAEETQNQGATSEAPAPTEEITNITAPLQTDQVIVDRLDALQEQLGILIANSSERLPERYQRPPPPPSTMTFLPFRASAGGGSVVLEDSPGLDYGVDDLALQILEMRPKDIRLIEISGESMQPTFQSGDIVVADASYPRRENLPDDNEIYLIGKNGELLVKRARWGEDRSLYWTSDNPEFSPIVDTDHDGDEIRTYGRVMWLWRRAN